MRKLVGFWAGAFLTLAFGGTLPLMAMETNTLENILTLTADHPFLKGIVLYTPDSAGKTLADMVQEINTRTEDWAHVFVPQIPVTPNKSLIRQFNTVLGGSFNPADDRVSASDFMKSLGITSLQGVYTPESSDRQSAAYITYSYYDPSRGGLSICVVVWEKP